MAKNIWSLVFLALTFACCHSVFGQDPILDLSFDSSFDGALGESPISNSGATLVTGVRGMAAALDPSDRIEYESAGNIDSQIGTIDFVIVPNWNGNDAQTHEFLVWDSLSEDNGGGLLFSKDGANNLRQIFNRFSQDGQSEIGTAINVSDWIAFEPHYLAYSWNATERRLRQYVDGRMVREFNFPDGFILPTITRSDFRLGNNTDGALDELRIFDRELSALEVESRFVDLVEGGLVNIGGGTIGDDFRVNFAQVDISGGSIGDSFRLGNTFANISGGSIGDEFTVVNESEINFIGSDFSLDGVPLCDVLTVDSFFEIFDRNVTLSGLLADGSEFSFDLNSSDVDGEDFFDPRSSVGVTLVSMPRTNAELLQNPGNDLALVEGEIPFWTEAEGENWTRRTGETTLPLPQNGDAFFFAGEGAFGELTQVVDVACFSSAIDAGTQEFSFSGYVRSFPQPPADSSRILVEYEDSSGNILSEFDSGEIVSEAEWLLVADQRLAPVGTRAIRIRLQSTRNVGGNNDGYFDSLSLFAVPQLNGDFDMDGDVDADDIDFYAGNLDLPATGDLDQLDLDGDGFVTLADHDLHVTTLAETSNGQTGALIGDTNLDGSVDVLIDAFALIGGLGTATGGYANGDLNADGVIDVLGDAFRLIGNLGLSNDPG